MNHTEWIDLLNRRKRLEYLIEQMAEGNQKDQCQKELIKMNKLVITTINSRRVKRKAPKFVKCDWGR